MYTVVIIEDDPMITRLNRRYAEQDSRFAVVQTFSAAHPALFWLQRNPIDLIILDVYMPQMSGTELLMQLRAKGVDADVIMVTSANDAKTVNDAVRLGAVDYLVKPFAYERFQQALEVFCRRRESVQRDSFSQDALDHTLFRQTAPAPSAAPPKGLQSQTLARIEAYLRAAPDERHTSDEIASHVGLSVVTVRRYMNYLTDRQIIGSEMDYRTGAGRVWCIFCGSKRAVCADTGEFQRKKRREKDLQLLCRRLEPGRTGSAHGRKAAGYRPGGPSSAAPLF